MPRERVLATDTGLPFTAAQMAHGIRGLDIISSLEGLNGAGRAALVEWLRENDHPELRALADAVEMFSAAMDAKDAKEGQA